MQSGGKAAKYNFMRKQISQLLDSNIELKQICDIVDCTPQYVNKIARLKKKGQDITTKYFGTKRRVRTEEFIEGIWSLRCSDPGMPIRQMAKHTEVSLRTTWRAVPSQPKHRIELKPDEDSRGGGGCALRRDTLGASRWRKPIRAGSVKISQASSAAVRDLVAVGDYRRSLLPDHGQIRGEILSQPGPVNFALLGWSS